MEGRPCPKPSRSKSTTRVCEPARPSDGHSTRHGPPTHDRWLRQSGRGIHSTLIGRNKAAGHAGFRRYPRKAPRTMIGSIGISSTEIADQPEISGGREMVAYWVARSKVNDPEQYKKYADLAPAIIGKFGGKFLARGGKFKILEGPEKFHRFIVIEFPSLERAVACHDSPEYRDAAAHRKKDGAGELEVVIVEGV